MLSTLHRSQILSELGLGESGQEHCKQGNGSKLGEA